MEDGFWFYLHNFKIDWLLKEKHRKRLALGRLFFTQVCNLGVADLPTLSRKL